MLGIIGCMAAFLLVIYLCYKNVHILLAALLGALLCIVFNGLPLMETLTTVYLPKMAGFFQGYSSFSFSARCRRIFMCKAVRRSKLPKLL